MDIESPPTSDDATKWKLFLPAFAYDRGGTSPETSSTDRKNLAEVGGDNAACPVPAMKLTEMTKADQSTFDAYIDKLEAEDFTYNDFGMAWGARLISQTGLFGGEIATAHTKDRPITRPFLVM